VIVCPTDSITTEITQVVSLYKFVPIADTALLQSQLRSLGEKHSVLGRLLVAPEGLNGTIATLVLTVLFSLSLSLSLSVRYRCVRARSCGPLIHSLFRPCVRCL
jgi:UPF0176 acylphosphatase like domain